MATGIPSTATQTISRTELFWLVGAFVFGSILRLSLPGRMAIEHFDEGVYASNFWFGVEQGFSYPARHLYAPPLLPAAIEWTMIVASLCGIKPTGFIPMIPCLVAGIAMIPSIWWVGRRWFGPSAGLISAWLVATSDFHASYSRAALTDVPVSLFIIWAVYFFVRVFLAITSYESPRANQKGSKRLIEGSTYPWRDIFMAGGFTGLAWWTKYNGWLPLAIGLAGGAFWQLLTPRAERQIRRSLTCWILIAAIACVIWSPVLWGLQKHGGYASVAANHRQYIVGVKGWGHSAVKQTEHLGLYDNWFGMFTESCGMSESDAERFDRDWPLFEILGWVRGPSQRTTGMKMLVQKLAILANRYATFLVPVVLLIVAGGALRLRLKFAKDDRHRVAACLLVAWVCGMTVATPLYHPYPRLVFPWLTAIWLGVGLAIQLWRNRASINACNGPAPPAKLWLPGRVEWVFVVWLVANSTVRSVQGTAHALRDRTSMEVVAASISRTIVHKVDARSPSNDGAIVFVWGEPALVFGLRANGISYVSPIQDLDAIVRRQPLPKFLVFGKQAFDGPAYPVVRAKLEHCELGDIRRIRPSHLVEMDSQNREHFYTGDTVAPKISLYRVLD